MSEKDDAALAARLERLGELADADLLRRGRHLSADIMLGVGAVPVYLAIAAGRVVSVETGPRLMRSWRFAIRGSARAWAEYWRPVPAPGWHDLFALGKRGEMAIEGDLQPFVANLQYMKDLLALPRRLAGASA